LCAGTRGRRRQSNGRAASRITVEPLEGKLGAEFQQPRAHYLYRVQPLVILGAVPCLLVQDGARVEYVVDVDISLHPGSAHREGPADTKIQLLNSIVEECVDWNQIDGDGLITCGRRLARTCREVPAQ